MEYKFAEIEEKWKKIWAERDIYKVTENNASPKFYVLDMFPYPSGAGLHVGHPLGYVASDIYARYKKLKGFNVLHPMGFDAFGLPAEQYALETGTHPRITTEKAIERYRSQYDKIGFNYDWSRSVITSDPGFYKWTQWIFLKLFKSWYNKESDKAEPIEELIRKFETEGCSKHNLNHKPIHSTGVNDHDEFTAAEWKAFSNAEQQAILMNYRLAYLSYAEVNWCQALGTVLANDEVKDGKSERGGHPVEKKKMRQWFLRITEYSDRLLEGLERIDWSESMKEMQRNWIGRSEGALVSFKILTPGHSPLERGTREGGAEERGMTPQFMTGKAETSKTNLIRAKEHRKDPTEPEEKLWQELRNQKLGFKFRRQHLIDIYIVDFVCLQKGLVIEVDGEIHEFTKQEGEQRTTILNSQGYKVIRFTNQQVLNDIRTVLNHISTELNQLNDKTEALSFGEGLGEDSSEASLQVFTTRPDTIFGATFMVIAAEHELVEKLTTGEQKTEVENYIAYVKSRSDVERQQEKKVTGVFTGSYAINPFNGEEIPIWIAEYVLIGYGTGAIMAVPADDERDKRFAEKFGLPIIDIIDKSMHPGATIEDKLGKMINSGFLDGLEVKDAIQKILGEIEKRGIGERKVNYRQRDAGFSRQRYWGEPFPIKYQIVGKADSHFEDIGEHDDIPIPLDESQLPLLLPEVSSYKPTGDGRAPLANNAEWVKQGYETDTMPGYAGSSWYFLRYMDANNSDEFAAKDKLDYWQNVDIYLGGTEHAVGHLLYARFWQKFLFDLGYVKYDEPFKRLVNQGMILGVSPRLYSCVVDKRTYRPSIDNIDRKNKKVKIDGTWFDCQVSIPVRIDYSSTEFVGEDLRLYQDVVENKGVSMHFIGDISLEKQYFKWDKKDENGREFISLAYEIEKMSKSKYNVVNPDDVIEKHGADCFRMFEMFLGPIEQSKPWDDKGISGVSNFLRKFWRLFYSDAGEWKLTEDEPTAAEYKVLHKTLKKVSEDIERLAFNTCVSSFMICTNELGHLNCHKKKILEPVLITLAPFAPFITEELWERSGNKNSIHHASFPEIDERYLVENTHEYPVSVNGKLRAHIALSLDLEQEEVKKQVLELETIKKWIKGAEPKKFIFVKGKIINVVI